MRSPRYSRIMVKLSGAAFAGEGQFGLDADAVGRIADGLLEVHQRGIEVAVVVGGGNFFRGNEADKWGIEHAEADNVGMLGTVMNGILLRGMLTQRGAEDVRLM